MAAAKRHYAARPDKARPPRHDPERPPSLRILSLGAGVQSSTLLLLACHGEIDRFDAAVFADTGWEPRAVHDHLVRLEETATRAGIPVYRVSAGNLRADALDARHRFASLPLFTLGPDGQRGLARRQCTSEYKIRPIKKKVRELLGHPGPGRVPGGAYAEMAIGISVDEVHRAKDADVGYQRNVFPLLDLGWRRGDCRTYLTRLGWGDTPRSACIGCPFHDNGHWRRLRDHSPAEWADALAFDEAIRHGHPRATATGTAARGTFYLHHTRLPLAKAPLGDDTDNPDRNPDGCSPWSCRSGPSAERPAAVSAGRDA